MAAELLRAKTLADITRVAHGFSTRQGGGSRGAFAHLNLSATIGDDRETVGKNRTLVLGALDRPNSSWINLKQVHGDQVVEVTRLAARSIEADAVWTRDPNTAIAVLVADCVPVLIADVQGRAIAAVHAGWRGTRAKISARTVERLKDAGFPPAQLRVAIGPAIGPCCFTIGAEVAAELRQVFGEATPHISNDAGRLCADLWALNVATLVEAGVPTENIEALRYCTSCTEGQFFSHRRDNGVTGRQCGVIALKPVN